jgi:hypothetical protein
VDGRGPDGLLEARTDKGRVTELAPVVDADGDELDWIGDDEAGNAPSVPVADGAITDGRKLEFEWDDMAGMEVSQGSSPWSYKCQAAAAESQQSEQTRPK